MRINFIRINRFLTLVALCLSLVHFTTAQTPVASPSPTAQQIGVKVDEYMKAAVQFSRFSGSILVARDGQPVISKGYGMANLEWDIPNTPQTEFRLGSITKPFTATAIMMLQERGKLGVNDPICKYLPNCPTAWQPITIRHLLTHTSGIPNFSSFPDYTKTMSLPVTHESIIALVKDKPLEFAPGEKFNYSNTGYYLLGVIIERASGKPYAAFLQENIFTPLNMKQTGYDTTRRIIKNRAAGYLPQGDVMTNALYLHMSIPFAAGALFSTTEDMLRWDQALYTEKLLSRKTLDEMFTPFKEALPGTSYGYGWGIKKMYDRQTLFHTGSINGFSTMFARFPAERVAVIVLSNNEHALSETIADDLAAIIFGASYKIPQARKERKAIMLDSKILDRYVGQYQIAPNFIITITNENGKLIGEATGQPKAELLAESETDFFVQVADLQITFVKDAQGQVTGLIIHQGGRDIPAQKIK